MKHLITIIGPNAVGKSTTAETLLNSCPRSAYVDSDCLRATNPFPFTEATKKAVTENIYCILKNFLLCEDIDTVIFPYSFHGERKDMFEEVVQRLEDENIRFELCYIILKCSEEENIRRAVCDGRDEERTLRGMKNTFHFYDGYDYPTIDTTGLEPGRVAEEIIKIVWGEG